MATDVQHEDRTRTYYNAFSETYDHHRDQGYHAMIDDMEMAIVAPFVKGKRVLELGCGTGLILERLQTHAQAAVGVDLSPGMAQKAKDRGLDVHVGSVTALPFEDESFDVVCSFKVLAHVQDISTALREAARVTKPGGHLILEFYNRWSLRHAIKRLGGQRATSNAHNEADVHTRWDTPATVSALLPPDVKLLDYHGIRVLTPVAAVHNVPRVSNTLRKAERWASTSGLRRFGGFLVFVLQRDAR